MTKEEWEQWRAEKDRKIAAKAKQEDREKEAWRNLKADHLFRRQDSDQGIEDKMMRRMFEGDYPIAMFYRELLQLRRKVRKAWPAYKAWKRIHEAERRSAPALKMTERLYEKERRKVLKRKAKQRLEDKFDVEEIMQSMLDPRPSAPWEKVREKLGIKPSK